MKEKEGKRVKEKERQRERIREVERDRERIENSARQIKRDKKDLNTNIEKESILCQ